MKRLLLLLLMSPLLAYGQEMPRALDEFVVWGRRPMKDIGVQRTDIDSAALKDNVAQSMADILTYNSSVFVKSYGRATLSTVAFRGTSPSHTRVTWNGLSLNSPMLGMTDFSTIPSFFIDKASLVHGTSSVNETGGGLGGLVALSTEDNVPQGLSVQYVQGVGSFRTFDEFARITYGSRKWTSSTRFAYSSSPNDYKYINHDKKENIYDESHNIVGQYHPTERNRSGSFKDLNALQEVYYHPNATHRISLSAWFTRNNRELPLLTTEYGDSRNFENRQIENTLRTVISWKHTSGGGWNTAVSAGVAHTRMSYDYSREISENNMAQMTASRSRMTTVFGQAKGEWIPTQKWLFNGSMTAHQQIVESRDKSMMTAAGGSAAVGYRAKRIELSGALSAKWQPVKRVGVSAVLRQEMCGDRWAPVIPALFVDGLLSHKGNIMVKASASRNHKFPTLNDLYFLPGGNPELKNERGWTYDAGISGVAGWTRLLPGSMSLSATWFDSRISDWIIWLPTTKGFFSPRNVKKVHAYGIELKANLVTRPSEGWLLNLNGSYSWTPSVNCGEPMTEGDRSVGKQLPYIPRHTASLTGRLQWRGWSLSYKWVYYSRRYTMSSNDFTLTGSLPVYFMNNAALEKSLSFKPVDLQMKLAVNNLFNEDYLSVLSRPMPGINFEFFVSITPRLKR